jgi:ribosomal protein S18 acetylase RimI-like enzyme
MEFTFIHSEMDMYAKYYSVYADHNIFICDDWNERIERLSAVSSGYFVLQGSQIIGGFILNHNELSYPFMVPPFSDRHCFWKFVLDFSVEACKENCIKFKYILLNDEQILVNHFNATLKLAQRMMMRPTVKINTKLDNGYYFVTPTEDDKPEIIQAVYDAHSTGYTSTVREINKLEIEEAINRRFILFTKTNTLHMSTLVRCKEDQTLAGVSIAGIYPNPQNNFSTIHQISVRPQYRRKGIAEAMMLNSISIASEVSPVTTLGVLIGNPAEMLYRKIGFSAGPRYAELSYAL